MTLAIVGGGSWGTALAIALAPRFSQTNLWVRNPELAESMQRTRVNATYLPGLRIPDEIVVTPVLAAALDNAEICILVVPSHHLRGIFTQMAPCIPADLPVISAVKGLETESLERMSEVIHGIAPQQPIGVFSGPSFAREVAAGKPTAMVIASRDLGLAERIQQLFATPTLRIYATADVVGVELGGALKNVIALAGGVCAGLELGHSALAALMTRGLAEITRLALAAGAEARTLSGLAGMGDLVLTCTGALSRNRQVGLELAKGRTIGEITASMQMVAEGVRTTAAALGLAQRWGVEMPIAEQMQQLLEARRSPHDAIRLLMERRLREESDN